MTAESQSAPQPSEGKGLATGTLGLWGSTVMGLASTAPVYSLVATLGWMVLAVGVHAPVVFVIAFVPMLFIAIAYKELNRAVPDCGTSFTWGAKAFGPWVGWMAGWGVAVAGIIVLGNLAQISGIYFWSLFGDGSLAENVPLVTATGAFFIVSMTYVSWRGLEIGEKLQNTLLGFQYAVLAAFVGMAWWKYAQGDAPDPTPFSWEWLNPFGFESLSGFTEAVLLAIFIYWGWDTCLALSEETKDPRRIPGRAALITTLVLLVTYGSVTIAAMMYAGVSEGGLGNPDEAAASDFFLAVKDGLFGPLAWVLVVSVLISAVSSTQTTILPTARGTLSMAVYKALPASFKSVHPRYKTPSMSTIVMGIVSMVFYVGMTFISDNVLQDSILSLGLAIAFYYAITGFSAVWYFRRDLRNSAKDLFNKGVFPLLGALMLTAAFVKSAIDMVNVDYGYSVLLGVGGTFVMGVGSLALGLVLMAAWAAFPESREYFRGKALNRDTAVLVPEEPLEHPRSIDGGIA